MQTSHPLDPLKQKTWQLDATNYGVEGYLYYCLLCDEALVLSRIQLSQRRITVAFDGRCPGCGYELDKVLSCRSSTIPSGRRLLTNLRCIESETLVQNIPQPEDHFQRASSLLRDGQSIIKTGIEQIDKTLVLTKGQMLYLQGEPSHNLSILFCARTVLPPPQGLDSDVVFIDAGNLFDTTDTSQHEIIPGLDNSRVQEKIHLSRAFTHHQVYNLIKEKLPSDIDKYYPALVIVSDITALFCDPDVREKKESLKMFKESTHFLARLAGERETLILVTSLKTRNRKMEENLSKAAHVHASLKDSGLSTRLKIIRHPFLQEGPRVVDLEYDALNRYFP